MKRPKYFNTPHRTVGLYATRLTGRFIFWRKSTTVFAAGFQSNSEIKKLASLEGRV